MLLKHTHNHKQFVAAREKQLQQQHQSLAVCFFFVFLSVCGWWLSPSRHLDESGEGEVAEAEAAVAAMFIMVLFCM